MTSHLCQLVTVIPDGIREFQDFPSASLGWMMYIGMAVVKMWDTEWERQSSDTFMLDDIPQIKMT